MSSALTRSVFRISRQVPPRLRLAPAPLRAQRLHNSAKRWEEAKLATVEPTTTTASAPNTAAALGQTAEFSTLATTQNDPASFTTEPIATSTTAEPTTTAAPIEEVVEEAEDAAPEATETDGVLAFDAWTVS